MDTDKKLELLHHDAMVIGNLSSLVDALACASHENFMSPEHAKNIWKAYLRVSGLDVPKDILKSAQEPKEVSHVSKKDKV